MSAPRMSALDPAGPQADHIATLWDIFLSVSIAVWVLVAVALAIAALVSRRRNTEDPLTADTPRDRNLIRGVVACGVLTVLTLIALLVASIASGNALAALEDDADAVNIRITGRQWWWDVTYEPDHPAKTAITANELVVPVGQIVHLELEAADVIHSFWVPSLHGKKDLIPGRRNRTWLRVDEAGTFRGQCAEFCGLEHANMAITVRAVPPAEFDMWIAHQRTAAEPPRTAQEAHGQRIFLAGPCVLCHAIAGTTAGAGLGPNLTHLASRQTLGASTMPNTPENLRAWITNPHQVKPYVRMPGLALAPADLDALVAYLRTLK
jgi:cytochrome c oxidase subunit 2